jgi:engulfment and cell motility protein 1
MCAPLPAWVEQFVLKHFLDSTTTAFQPFFLNFYKVHALATNFFIRMWSESGAAFGDFTRVVALVRSQ